MPHTRTFTAGQLIEWGLPYDLPDGMELHREQVAERRWTSVNRLVFRAPDDGRTWAVTYEEGLTEMQDIEPWGYNRDTKVTATEVVQREVTVTRWVPADDAEAGRG